MSKATIRIPTPLRPFTNGAAEVQVEGSTVAQATRGLRFPGLISHVAPPGGGTTDYAVDIFYQAIRYRHYTCFLAADCRLDMMYMPDAVRAMIALMEADPARLGCPTHAPDSPSYQ